MSNFQAPSTTLLRAFLKPSNLTKCAHQIRHAGNYMPRHKYASITRLDKLHRVQKAAIRQEKLAAIERADALSISMTKSTDLSSSIDVFPFQIARTPGSQLPVYETAKNGGNRQITTLQKLTGDLDSLAEQLRGVLKLPEFVVDRKGNKKANVAINRLTGHVVVRGWRGLEVKAWLEGVGF